MVKKINGVTTFAAGTQVMVQYIIGDRVIEAASAVDHTSSATFVTFEQEVVVDGDGIYEMSPGYFYAKHLRDAVPSLGEPAETLGKLRFSCVQYSNKALRRSCQQHGLQPLVIPGGNPPLRHTTDMVVANYSMNGSSYFIVPIVDQDNQYTKEYLAVENFAKEIEHIYNR